MRRLVLLVLFAASCTSKHGTGDADAGSGLCATNDCDGDGYASDDCNDDDPLVNPGAYDFHDAVDNDCDGVIDDPIEACETVPAAPPGAPVDFARAADVCAQRAYDPLVDARWGKVSG